jgi:NAD kinase
MYLEKIINNHIIFYSEYKYNDKQDIIEKYLNSWEFINFLKKLEWKYNIILGWDGTMLEAIKRYHKNWNKFIPINFWSTWFLLQDKFIISVNNDFIDYSYSLFDIYINWEYSTTFTNEINITASAWKIWEYSLKIWNKETFYLKWDWLLISTPLGSTAYNKSLWWPILLHNSNSIVLTAKAAHTPKWFTSLVLNENENIIIENIWRFDWLEIYADSIWWKINTQNTCIEVKKSNFKLMVTIDKSEVIKWNNKTINFLNK